MTCTWFAHVFFFTFCLLLALFQPWSRCLLRPRRRCFLRFRCVVLFVSYNEQPLVVGRGQRVGEIRVRFFCFFKVCTKTKPKPGFEESQSQCGIVIFFLGVVWNAIYVLYIDIILHIQCILYTFHIANLQIQFLTFFHGIHKRSTLVPSPQAFVVVFFVRDNRQSKNDSWTIGLGELVYYTEVYCDTTTQFCWFRFVLTCSNMFFSIYILCWMGFFPIYIFLYIHIYWGYFDTPMYGSSNRLMCILYHRVPIYIIIYIRFCLCMCVNNYTRTHIDIYIIYTQIWT